MSDASRVPTTMRLASLCVHGTRRLHAHHAGGSPVASTLVRGANFVQSEESYRAIRDGRGDQVPIYSRYSNPTVDAVEERIAALEGAEASLLFASGMAALHAAIVACAPPGSTLVASRRLYGGTSDLLENGMRDMGYGLRRVDLEGELEAAQLERSLAGASLVLCESIANPTLEVPDLPLVAAGARAVGARLLVDATFASPIAQRPLALGADLVMHSATKLLGGHSDLIAGVVSGSERELAGIRAWRKRAGGCLAPDVAWLLERGLKTLALRVRVQSESAARIAEHLSGHAAVRRVLYPGLATHPSYSTARALLSWPGCVLAFEHVGGDEGVESFVRALELWIDAPSLGGVESLVSLPCLMSHAHLSAGERSALGIGPGFARLSVGIEDAEDLIADLEQALSVSQRHSRPFPARQTT